MKAVLRRFNPTSRRYEKVVLADNAEKITAVGDVVRALSASGDLLAVARLLQGEYVRLEGQSKRGQRPLKLFSSD